MAPQKKWRYDMGKDWCFGIQFCLVTFPTKHAKYTKDKDSTFAFFVCFAGRISTVTNFFGKDTGAFLLENHRMSTTSASAGILRVNSASASGTLRWVFFST